MTGLFKRYDKSIAIEIVQRVSEGETLQRILADPRMPSKRTFYGWLADDADLRRVYRMAREFSAYALEEDALETARSLKDDPNATRDKISRTAEFLKQARWSAEKRNAHEFGASAKGVVTVPITINTTLDMGKAPDQLSDTEAYALRLETAIDPEKEDDTDTDE